MWHNPPYWLHLEGGYIYIFFFLHARLCLLVLSLIDSGRTKRVKALEEVLIEKEIVELRRKSVLSTGDEEA